MSMLCNNRYYSALYASLFINLTQWPIFTTLFQQLYDTYLNDLLHITNESSDDYDKYCECNKRNESLKMFSLFIVHLQQHSSYHPYYDSAVQKIFELIDTNLTCSCKEIMNELLAPLNSEQREIMSELMESVKTSKLNESFEKYLPAVIAGKAPQKKQALLEAKEITGNKTISNSNRSSEEESNIIDIRRLAGLKI